MRLLTLWFLFLISVSAQALNNQERFTDIVANEVPADIRQKVLFTV